MTLSRALALVTAWALLLAAPAWAQTMPGDGPESPSCMPDIYEPDNVPAQATFLTPDDVLTTMHTFNPADDQDYLRFQAAAGATYILTTHNLTGGADTVLTVWGQDGTTHLAHNDDDPTPGRGLASRIEWTAPADGTYFASVREFMGNDECRSYRLSVAMEPLGQTYAPQVYKNLAWPQPTPTVCAPSRVVSVTVGTHPKAVAVGPGRAYVSLYDSASLAVVNTISHTLVRTVSGGGVGGNGVALSGDYVYMAHRDSANVSVFRTAEPNAYLRAIPVGQLPFGVVALPDRVYVANYGSDSVSVIDSATNTALHTVPVGAHPALAAAGGARGWITALGGQSGLKVLDRDGNLVRTIATGPDPFGVAYDPLLGRLFVSHWGDNSLWAIDAANGNPLARVVLPGKPFAVAVNFTTGHLFVILAGQNQMVVLRESDLTQIISLPLESQGGDDGGQSIALYENRIYVPNYGAGSLTVFQDTTCNP